MSIRMPSTVRLMTDAATLRAWVRDHPLAPVAPAAEDAGAGPIPPSVAAAMAVHAGAEASVSVRVWTPWGGSLTCVAVAADLGSSVSCEGVPPPGPPVDERPPVRLWQQPAGALGADASGPVEVALFPARDVVAEAFRGVPAVPPLVASPLAAGVQVAVAGADDAAPCWQETLLAGTGRWRRVLPSDFSQLATRDAEYLAEGHVLDPLPRTLHALATDLRYVLTGCLERGWADDNQDRDP